MAPNVSDLNGVLFEDDAATADMALGTAPVMKADKQPLKFVWRNIILFAYLHLAAVYGGYLFLFKAQWLTCIFGKFFSLIYYTYTASPDIRERSNVQRERSLSLYSIINANLCILLSN